MKRSGIAQLPPFYIFHLLSVRSWVGREQKAFRSEIIELSLRVKIGSVRMFPKHTEVWTMRKKLTSQDHTDAHHIDIDSEEAEVWIVRKEVRGKLNTPILCCRERRQNAVIRV